MSDKNYCAAIDMECRTVRDLRARVAALEAALERICQIEDKYSGGDWDEIEEARSIASKALRGEGETP